MKGMAAAANYAWVNRSTMTFLTRQAFGKVFKSTPDDLDMHVIYDVSHNIAKIEEHVSLLHLLRLIRVCSNGQMTNFDETNKQNNLRTMWRILCQRR